ncbi:TNF receptor-associated factor 5-like [Orbicella faveolata]|uniref:TNF receptor-associated factor 5-like n=1 Tax=Orbicella faveolata TaxID=48498 RepID=UPI0009E26221|nr:TNF receptor-associated factor 5-like [Orbicella faveolata]
MLSKRDMKTHKTLECSWRKVNCEYCQESVIMNQRQGHLDICRKFPVLCTNKCGRKDIPREKLEVHVRYECPATRVQCMYKNIGCEAMFPRSDAKSHSQTQIESHLHLAVRGLEAAQHHIKELVTVVRDQSQQIERLMSKDKEQSLQIERQSQQIDRLLSNDKEQSQQITVSKINQVLSTPFEWTIPNFEDL